MKKVLILTAAMIISISAFSQSYKQAIGIKIGSTLALEYKLNLSPQNFLQFDLLLPWNTGGLYFSGFYNWKYNMDTVPGLSLYVGPGACLGMDFDPNQFYLSINAMLGVEYKFDTVPIALSLDITPGIGISPNYHLSYNVGLGIKYTL